MKFSVTGVPKPKGSARAFVAGKRAIVTNDCAAAKPWQEHVHWIAREHAPPQPLEGPVAVTLAFVMPRPGRLGKRRTGVLSTTRPDVDKLARLVLDALTGIFWIDDAQVAFVAAGKQYADHGTQPGVIIEVESIADEHGEQPPEEGAGAAQLALPEVSR